METIEIRDALLFIAPLAASAVTLAAMHWFPGAQELPRTAAYAVGTLITVGVPALAMLLAALVALPQGELFWASLLIANALVSGATVNAAYWVDSKRPISLEDMANERG